MSTSYPGGTWTDADYPVRCDVHKAPIPPGEPFRVEPRCDNRAGPYAARRVCFACDLLATVIGQPVTDPRKSAP